MENSQKVSINNSNFDVARALFPKIHFHYSLIGSVQQTISQCGNCSSGNEFRNLFVIILVSNINAVHEYEKKGLKIVSKIPTPIFNEFIAHCM